MAKKFNIHDWQSKYLFEQDNFTPDLEDDDLKRSKIQQMMAKEKEPMGGDEKLRNNVEAIADMYSYGEILDALESFYIKNDEQQSAEMARKHAKEFREFLGQILFSFIFIILNLVGVFIIFADQLWIGESYGRHENGTT